MALKAIVKQERESGINVGQSENLASHIRRFSNSRLVKMNVSRVLRGESILESDVTDPANGGGPRKLVDYVRGKKQISADLTERKPAVGKGKKLQDTGAKKDTPPPIAPKYTPEEILAMSDDEIIIAFEGHIKNFKVYMKSLGTEAIRVQLPPDKYIEQARIVLADLVAANNKGVDPNLLANNSEEE